MLFHWLFLLYKNTGIHCNKNDIYWSIFRLICGGNNNNSTIPFIDFKKNAKAKKSQHKDEKIAKWMEQNASLDPMSKIQSSRKILATAMTFKRPIFSLSSPAMQMNNIKKNERKSMHITIICKWCSWQWQPSALLAFLKLFRFKHQDTKQRKTTIKDCRDISDPIMSRMIGNGKAYKIGNEWKWSWRERKKNWWKKNV